MALSRPTATPSPLRTHRVVLGWSQAELAARSGVGLRQLTRLERGECNPRWGTVRALADALDVDPRSLFPRAED